MTKEDAAALLNGFEYPAREIETHAKALKEAGLVAVFGQSDDLMEFRGAIYDETDAYNGARVLIDSEGLIPTFDAVSDEGDEEMMAAYFRRKPLGVAVEAIWSPDDLEASWLIRTEIPHATFGILEDGDLFCRGVVFALADATTPARNTSQIGEG
jgi:hypothetical protein